MTLNQIKSALPKLTLNQLRELSAEVLKLVGKAEDIQNRKAAALDAAAREACRHAQRMATGIDRSWDPPSGMVKRPLADRS
jgi:hypothetical protein